MVISLLKISFWYRIENCKRESFPWASSFYPSSGPWSIAGSVHCSPGTESTFSAYFAVFRNTATPIHLIVSITAFAWRWQSWVLLQMPYEHKSLHFYFAALYRKMLSVPELQKHSYYEIKKNMIKENKKSWDAFTNTWH